MTAALIAVQGANAGASYRLTQPETLLGRAEAAAIRLSGMAASWRHCVIQLRDDGACELADLRSGCGTYVNGLRINRHILEDGDHIGVGDELFVFRSDASGTESRVRPTLLPACSLLFLFRALADSINSAAQQIFEAQLLDLIGDFVPMTQQGLIVIAKGQDEVLQRARERGLPLTPAMLAMEGICVDKHGRHLIPIYLRGELCGVIAIYLQGPREEADTHRDTLAALATLAGAALEGAYEVATLRAVNTLLRQEAGLTPTGIVGDSPALRRLLQLVDRVAPHDTTVLILGESGTGKELIARAIHERSPRRDHPFVAINCAALTETLLESELFGHEKGAFTGAVAQKKGKLELAEGGTVFLDEMGELAPALQAKLLRVLQQREFERVGGTRTLRLNVRIVAATNRDLAAEVRSGAFREDLYHRLNVVALRTPSLRDRPDDIPALAKHFLQRAAARSGRAVQGISPAAADCLQAYPWPGNVRELENAIERAVVLGETAWVLPEDLPDNILDTAPAHSLPPFQASVGDAKRDAIVHAWREARGDYKQAALHLGLHPNSLLRLIRQLRLRECLAAAVPPPAAPGRSGRHDL